MSNLTSVLMFCYSTLNHTNQPKHLAAEGLVVAEALLHTHKDES